jgi:hypothetical protein
MASKVTLLRKLKVPVDDRRALARMPGSGITLVRPEQSGKAVARSGRIVDFSRSGIAFLLNQPFPLGTLLTLSPIGWDRASPLEANVIHCREVDGQWLHGCQFLQKLNRRDMEHFFSFNLKVS